MTAPVLYQQGAHTYSTRFYSGGTESFSAQAAKPPVLPRYTRPPLLWVLEFSLPFSGDPQVCARLLAIPALLGLWRVQLDFLSASASFALRV